MTDPVPHAAIHVCALGDLDAVASALGDYRLLSLLSPTHADLSWTRHARDAHLHLAFNDIVVPQEGLIAPDRDTVSAIIGFGRDASSALPLLIHCWAGISRSSAAAYIIACDTNPGRESTVADELRQRAPFATPNRLMVAIADDILQRDGRMIDAITRIGRGAEALAGTPYVMPLLFPLPLWERVTSRSEVG